jgi:glycosyltransferase involved in cell wall biosynthesis
MRIAIVIPAYNESRTIRDIVARALRQSPLVIVVDDGSTDGTSACVSELPVTLLLHDDNRGKGAALVTGFSHALSLGIDAVVTMDGDGQHRAEDVPRLVAAARAHPNRLIVAARLKSRDAMPRLRYWGNRLADLSVAWAAGHAIVDSQSGQRLYPAPMLVTLLNEHDIGTLYAFESDMLIRAARLGYTCIAVPIEAIYDAAARPSHYRLLRDTAGIARVIWGHLRAIRWNPRVLWRVARTPATVIASDELRSTLAPSGETFRQPGS